MYTLSGWPTSLHLGLPVPNWLPNSFLPHRVAERMKWYPAVRSLVHAWHTERGQHMVAFTKHENCPPHSWAPTQGMLDTCSFLTAEGGGSSWRATTGDMYVWGLDTWKTLMTWHIILQEELSHRPCIPPSEGGTSPPKLALTLSIIPWQEKLHLLINSAINSHQMHTNCLG